MERRTFISGVTLGLGTVPLGAWAQQSVKTARIGALSLACGPNPNMDIFLGLRESLRWRESWFGSRWTSS
jgi:hypothetical protein